MYLVIKRGFDFIFSILVLIILCPFLLILMSLILIQMGSPVFFVQKRTTMNERIFKLYKFRTMSNALDKEGKLLPDNKRVTSVGKFLRATSLDELPELINILKGDMSIVGPRPLLPEYHSFYFELEMDRFKCKGGLIPPEVLYKDMLPNWDCQLKYESIYGKNVSILVDIKIFFSVFSGLLFRSKNGYGTYERTPLSMRGLQR